MSCYYSDAVSEPSASEATSTEGDRSSIRINESSPSGISSDQLMIS